MEEKHEKIREHFNREMKEFLQIDKKDSIPVKLEILQLKELPDLSEWRTNK